MTPNRKKLLAAGVIAAVAAAAIAWWRLRGGAPEQGFIVDMVAVDADTAVLVWRANYDDGPSRSWVSRVDGHGRARWVRRLPAVVFTGRSLMVHGDVVTVRYGHEEDYDAIDHSVAAFSLADGRPLWDELLTVYHPQPIEGYGTTEAHLRGPALPRRRRSRLGVRRDVDAVRGAADRGPRRRDARAAVRPAPRADRRHRRDAHQSRALIATIILL